MRVETAGGKDNRESCPLPPEGRRWERPVENTSASTGGGTHSSGRRRAGFSLGSPDWFRVPLGTCHPWLIMRMQEGMPQKIRKTKPFWKWKQEAPTCPKLQTPKSPSQLRDELTLIILHRLSLSQQPLLDLSPILHFAASLFCRGASLALQVQVQSPNDLFAFSFQFSPLLPLKVFFLQGGQENI